MKTKDGESPFMRIADRVSYAMGTWQNILVWFVLVTAWFIAGPYVAHHSFLPSWFTSNDFNFPLNTVTTIAELYIGFLVGASTNRSERHSQEQADRIEALEQLISAELKRNSQLTEDAHAIAEEVRAQVPVVQQTRSYLEKLLALAEAPHS
jgi:hypothetical protein